MNESARRWLKTHYAAVRFSPSLSLCFVRYFARPFYSSRTCLMERRKWEMLSLNIDNFEGNTILDSRNILALFYATWCPFCRTFVLTFEEAMQGRDDPLGALVDISDMNSLLWERFNVEIVPTLIGFKEGRILLRKDGVAGVGLSRRELEDAIREMR